MIKKSPIVKLYFGMLNFIIRYDISILKSK